MAKYEEMCKWLEGEGFEDDILDVFRSNRIDSKIFLELNKDDFEDLGVTALGDKKRLNLLKKKIICAEVSDIPK